MSHQLCLSEVPPPMYFRVCHPEVSPSRCSTFMLWRRCTIHAFQKCQHLCHTEILPSCLAEVEWGGREDPVLVYAGLYLWLFSSNWLIILKDPPLAGGCKWIAPASLLELLESTRIHILSSRFLISDAVHAARRPHFTWNLWPCGMHVSTCIPL